jgi:hypothetical protein
MDVCGSILANLDAGYFCRHDEVRISFSVGGRKIMNRFVVNLLFGCGCARLGEVYEPWLLA